MPYSRFENLQNCTLCPRNCHTDRTANKEGACHSTSEVKIARASLHHWEEPCISGTNGSGTVFFCGCNLGCIFCQNRKISRGKVGKTVSIHHLAEIFLELQEQKAHNINLVTPTHYAVQIIAALDEARSLGLHLPILYNSSGYESIDTLKMLEGYIDIYLPDCKYYSSKLSQQYSHAADYFQNAQKAIREMVRQVGSPVFDNSTEIPLMKKGVMVRHLLLPDCLSDSKAVLGYLFTQYQNHIYYSIMNQYTPIVHIEKYPSLNRKVTKEEYDSLLNYALSLGIENGFFQEGDTAQESFIPDFL
jgi:putative pyruvate formate lyase activating enzyme